MYASSYVFHGFCRIFSLSTAVLLTACAHSNLFVDHERAYHTVEITTFPSQALIYLNGEKIGLSPLTAKIERLHEDRQKIAALPLFEHQFQQLMILESGRLPNELLINMDIPNEITLMGKKEPEPEILPVPEVVTSACTEELDQLPSLFFDTNVFNLSEAQRASIQTLVCNLATYNYPELAIYGIADQHGSQGYNYELGLKRAQSTMQAMLDEGYPSSQLKLFSYGESIVHDATLNPTQDAFNRRVYFELVK